jgi:hypothetical protein
MATLRMRRGFVLCDGYLKESAAASGTTTISVANGGSMFFVLEMVNLENSPRISWRGSP